MNRLVSLPSGFYCELAQLGRYQVVGVLACRDFVRCYVRALAITGLASQRRRSSLKLALGIDGVQVFVQHIEVLEGHNLCESPPPQADFLE